MSMTQQVLDLKEQIKALKIDLRNREARLIGIQEILNQVLADAHVNSSVLYKNINKQLTELADQVDNNIMITINTGLQNLTRLTPSQQTMLSAKFRNQEQLLPLLVEGEQGA